MEPRDRVEAYILNVELVLEQLKDKVDEPYKRLLVLAKLYISDSKYYLERGDIITALACVAYAEGLLDALRHLGVVDIEWKPLTELISRPLVLVAGSFEIIHPGHIALLREAWKRGKVLVVVSRDSNLKKFKGREPIVPEEQRLEVVSSIRYVSHAVLGDEVDLLKPVLEAKPDIILLGPDQNVDEKMLEEALARRGLRVKVERFRRRINCPYCSSTRIACRAAKVVEPLGCEEALPDS